LAVAEVSDRDRLAFGGGEALVAAGGGDRGRRAVAGGDRGEVDLTVLLHEVDPDGVPGEGGVGFGDRGAGEVVGDDLLPAVALERHPVGAVLAHAHGVTEAPAFEGEGGFGGGDGAIGHDDEESPDQGGDCRQGGEPMELIMLCVAGLHTPRIDAECRLLDYFPH
jgi:hypothetical protein